MSLYSLREQENKHYPKLAKLKTQNEDNTVVDDPLLVSDSEIISNSKIFNLQPLVTKINTNPITS